MTGPNDHSDETGELLPVPVSAASAVPALIENAGAGARFAFEEFFRAELENEHTTRAYKKAVTRFLSWCESQNLGLLDLTPGLVGDYLKNLTTEGSWTVTRVDPVSGIASTWKRKAKIRVASKPMRKLHLAALRHFFDVLVLRHALPLNPALSVRGPKHSVSEGKTPAFRPKDVRTLLEAIPIRLPDEKQPGVPPDAAAMGASPPLDRPDPVGLRDRALIATLVFTAARVGAVAKLRRKDFYSDGHQFFLRLDEKGGKIREIPVRHDLEADLKAYIAAAGPLEPDAPLFRTARRRTKTLTENGMGPNDVLQMVKRRLKASGLSAGRFTCHSFRATTATNLLEQGVPLEDVQYLLGHSDARTTKLYDRRKRAVTRNIVERIAI